MLRSGRENHLFSAQNVFSNYDYSGGTIRFRPSHPTTRLDALCPRRTHGTARRLVADSLSSRLGSSTGDARISRSSVISTCSAGCSHAIWSRSHPMRSRTLRYSQPIWSQNRRCNRVGRWMFMGPLHLRVGRASRSRCGSHDCLTYTMLSGTSTRAPNARRFEENGSARPDLLLPLSMAR
jgi:hypothetical protein